MPMKNASEPTVRKRSDYQLVCPPEDQRTKQSFTDECNINNIMAHYRREGLVAHVAAQAPEYGDYTNAISYQEAKNALIRADQAFMSLPAEVRRRMQNDPGQFLDFMANPDNEEEARELGLIDPKAELPASAPAETPEVSSEVEPS